MSTPSPAFATRYAAFPHNINYLYSREILTGKVPLYELSNDLIVMFKVVEGQRPSRSISCSGTTGLDSLWELLLQCWEGEAEKRPTAPQVVERLVGPSIQAKTTSSTADWDDKFTSKFRRSQVRSPLLPSVADIERALFGGWLVQIPILSSSMSLTL
jgi:hypothetical protein